MAGRGGLARIVSLAVAAGAASAPEPSAATGSGGATSAPGGPSLVQGFERAFSAGRATPPAGSASENLTQGYRLLNQAGNLPWDRTEEKRALLEQAYQAARASGDATLVYQAGFFLATVLRQVGENERALAILKENVALVRRTNLPFNAESAIGGHLAAVGEVERAVEIFRQGLQTAQRNRYDVANAERRLAVALMMAKRFDEAREVLEDALRALARERLGDGALEVFAPLNGVVPSAEERTAAEMMARTAKLRAQLIAAGAPGAMVRSSLPERLGAFERSRIDRWLDFSRLREWTAALQGHAEEAFALAQIGRKELLDTTWFLDDTWLDHVSERKSRPTSEVLAQARLAARRLRTTIVEYSPLFSLAPNLPVLGGNPPRLEGVLAWVITRNGRFTQRTVKSDAALAALAALIRDQDGVLAVARGEAAPRAPRVGQPDRGFTLAGTSGPATPARDPLVDLYDLLIRPIEDLLPREAGARVVFVPRDELVLVPFVALTDRRGRQVVDHLAVWTAPGLDLLTRRASKRASGRGALVVEVSSGAAVSTVRDAWRRTLPPLPGAKAEAEDVARLLGTRVVNSHEAVKTEVMRRMGQAAVIHLAAHGLSDDNKGLLSSLALEATGPDDGLLTAREVMGLRLSADLVVLSACDSGRGAVQGDSLYGLPRAFLTAGARSVLSSLWKAADEPTRMLVKVFFRELLAGTEKARALRRAMIATRAKYPAPANWAGFVLTGEPDLAGASPSWRGTPPVASAVLWRRPLFPVPIDAHLLTDKEESVTFTIARNHQAVIDYYSAALAAAGYTEQVKARQTSGASFELSFARGPAEDLVRVIGLSVVSTLGGPAASGEPELMVTVDYKHVLPTPMPPASRQ